MDSRCDTLRRIETTGAPDAQTGGAQVVWLLVGVSERSCTIVAVVSLALGQYELDIRSDPCHSAIEAGGTLNVSRAVIDDSLSLALAFSTGLVPSEAHHVSDPGPLFVRRFLSRWRARGR